MIIGIDASRANDDKKTGVGWYAYNTIQEFKKIIPDNVRVVLYSRESLKGDLAVLPENWSVKVLKWPPKRFWTQMRLSWEMLFHSPNVLFIPAHVFPIIHPKKTVMAIHDIAAVKFPGSYNWFERWYTIWSAKYALKKLWKIITISKFTKNELKNEFGARGALVCADNLNLEKVKITYLGYNKEYKEASENINEVLKKYNIEKPYLFSVGRLEKKKNTIRIIKAFERIRHKTDDLKLVLVGSPGHGYEKVKDAIENSAYKEDIIVPGWVENNDLPALMQGADVFVFPSLYEGFGIPVLEAFVSGTPVVASPGASQEIGGDACEYVDPLDVDDIVRGIEKARQGNNIKRGKERVKNFSWEKCARETWEVLSQ